MSTSKIILGGAVAVAAIGIGAAVYQTAEVKHRDAAAVNAAADQAALAAKVRDLETRVAAESKRAQAADDDNAKLLKVIEGLRALRPARTGEATAVTEPDTTGPITPEVVQARYDRAKELARSGNAAAALKEFLWCYDVGMTQMPRFAGVRVSFLLSDIAKLGEQYPEALAVLRARRDDAQKRFVASASDTDAATTFSSINRVLKDDQATMALYDQLPPTDTRRRALAGNAYDQLVASQRYADALVGRPYSTLSSLFESGTRDRPLPANVSNPEMLRKAMHNGVINSTSQSIEVLAGAGELALARVMADKLIAYDGSEETKAIIQQHAARAGHPELLGLPAGGK